MVGRDEEEIYKRWTSVGREEEEET
jgi:hypothetical protein